MPANSPADVVGPNIRAEMGRRRISMLELSRRTGVNRTTLAEQIDTAGVRVNTLVLIAQALGVKLSDLLPDEADTEAAS
jgi:transcriptional regulator with XRE-family HTH domain